VQRRKIYLAGPDVFLPDAREIGQRKCALCASYGFEGLFPLDGTVDAPPGIAAAQAIYRGNLAMMRDADAVIANLTPFRGPGADPGTAFELGFMAALGRPLLAYSNDPRPLLARVAAGQSLQRRADGAWADADGMEVEDFGLADNLMLDGALREARTTIIVQDCDPSLRFTDLAAFERCLGLAWDSLVR
jgi:nucleoside 2-deoxyribosyltransferase